MRKKNKYYSGPANYGIIILTFEKKKKKKGLINTYRYGQHALNNCNTPK